MAFLQLNAAILFFLSSTKRINNLENDTLFFMEVTLFVI